MTTAPLPKTGPLLTYADLSSDPTARARSGLRDALIAEVRALGYTLLGWVGTHVCADHANDSAAAFVTAVLVARDGRSLATLTCTGGMEEVTFATLFADGSVVQTGRVPNKNWWYLRWGLVVPARHAYLLAYVRGSAADVLALHEARLAAEETCGKQPIAPHDLRVHFAIRKRYREIADARMRKQQAVAGQISWMAGIAGAASVVVPAIGRVHDAGTAAAVGMLALVAGVVVSIAAFVVALYFVAPFFARSAAAPPARPARELV